MLDVLIVEDSAAIRMILQRILRQTDMPLGDIWQAGDGNEALAVLREKNVGLVLSDINMPNMNGLELLKHMRSNPAWKDLPVVMVTTEGNQASVTQAVELGAVGYIRKPFTVEQ